jgi:hypothetical protein
MLLIGVANQTEPQAVLSQMKVDLFGKDLPFTGRIQGVEATTVKHEAEWRSVNVVVEDVQNGKSTAAIRFGSFFSGLLYRNLRNVNPGNIEILLH